MSHKEAVKDNLNKASQMLEYVTSDEDKPVDVAQVYATLAQAYVNAAIVSAIQDLTSEVHELVKKK